MSAQAPVAVVTGGATGLGREIARRLHAGGHRVAVADISAGTATELAAELSAQGPDARAYAVDIGERTAVEKLYAEVVADYGSVEVLVNCAARTEVRPLLEITPDELDQVMRVNLNGTFYSCQVFGTAMAETGYGRIVNIASLAGQNGGTATGGHYASSKGAVLSATKVFARELAARGVTVNAVSPGPQDGPMIRELLGEGLDGLVADIPVGRLGSMRFIADMVALLASAEAASVTGACWDANGGLYLR
ncbi:MAG TPA: SDR family oxidoreductase [Nocardioides sp.]|nr:SDR family oxidoreductase [Nocardioides sp.]